jgi:Zn-finger in ubiquitin-hydrolases and other protein
MEVCSHLDQIIEVTASADGCEDCLRMGGSWVHLRLCMSCGHVGCCDSSPHKHATAHFHSSGHPIIRTFEPGENWGWCYVDEVELDPTDWPVRGRVAHSVR